MKCPACGYDSKESPIERILRYAKNCASRERARAERCREPLRSRALHNAESWEAGVDAIAKLMK